MPYLKFSRDKRGYEHFSIVEPGAPRRGKPARPRVLFWFRTPPQIRVGRHPFTEEVQRAIEAQNPGIRFDWPRLLATPIPPPDAEHWRERRLAEKAAKLAAREAEGAPDADEAPHADEAPGADDVDAAGAVEVVGDEVPRQTGAAPETSDLAVSTSGETGAGDAQPAGGRRRNRRRRRRRHNAGGPAPAGAAPAAPGPPTDEV